MAGLRILLHGVVVALRGPTNRERRRILIDPIEEAHGRWLHETWESG